MDANWSKWTSNQKGQPYREIVTETNACVVKQYVDADGRVTYKDPHGANLSLGDAHLALVRMGLPVPRSLPEKLSLDAYPMNTFNATSGQPALRGSRDFTTQSGGRNNRQQPRTTGSGLTDQILHMPQAVSEIASDQRQQFHRTSEAQAPQTRPTQSRSGLSHRSHGTSISYGQGNGDRGSSLIHRAGLPSDFCREPYEFFEIGRVFWTLWWEPNGKKQQQSPGASNDQDPQKPYYYSLRPMVVIKRLYAHCLCLPVYTNSSQGVLKEGLNWTEIKQHAVIYDSRNEAWADDEEVRKGLTRAALAVKVNPKLESKFTLNEWSRLRYDSVCTIRYNWRVLGIGTLRDVQPFVASFVDALMHSINEQRWSPNRRAKIDETTRSFGHDYHWAHVDNV